jgi:hypothetical protein
MVWFRIGLYTKPLRDTPRFEAWLAKMNFPPQPEPKAPAGASDPYGAGASPGTGEVDYFWPASGKSLSVPTTWPCSVPGMRVSRWISPEMASAMVTRLASRVRPRARS